MASGFNHVELYLDTIPTVDSIILPQDISNKIFAFKENLKPIYLVVRVKNAEAVFKEITAILFRIDVSMGAIAYVGSANIGETALSIGINVLSGEGVVSMGVSVT